MKQPGHLNNQNIGKGNEPGYGDFRKSAQFLMPSGHVPTPPGEYDIYPGFDIGSGKIGLGFPALAEKIAPHPRVIIDGYIGIMWEDVRRDLDCALKTLGVSANWVDVSKAFKNEEIVEEIVKPFLGGDDPLFGTRYPGRLEDFFDPERLRELQPDPGCTMNIVYGCGASLAGWKGFLVYIDLPKIEVQFRSRAGRVCNLGQKKSQPPKPQYKRFYFVDWVVLNKHKADIFPRIDLVVDGQRPQEPAIADAEDLRRALDLMSENSFRVRPWFEPGPWGGSWIQDHIKGLSTDVPNYAWSYELIVPENGLILASGGRLLEVSFDFLMFRKYCNVLGDFSDRFKWEFPIRYDFLDTFDGGNLSVQCHPRPDYARSHFGENFTQDEAYYILDCKPGSGVFLGFNQGIDPKEFRNALEQGYREFKPVDVTRFVNFEKAKKHDFFLIPGGTIHGSGVNNLVLEISATTYNFTFKMYDWMRMDLDGRPRPINIERAFDNLYFERQGEVVKQEHISRPHMIDKGSDWEIFHLPTHRDHFYDVHRIEFHSSVELRTNGSPHVMSLVEGESVLLETTGTAPRRFNYAETFVIPAAAQSYRLKSESGKPVKVVKTFLKPDK